MKHYLKPLLAMFVIFLLTANPVQAGNQEKMVIALKTTDFELTETDISDLAIGEAQTIETDSGKVIDILRTAEGAEIYIDGELLEMDFDDEGLHEEHMIRKHVEVICDEGEECDKNVFVLAGDGHSASGNIIIQKEIELSCTDEEEGTSCSDEMIWVSDGEDIDLEELHEMHEDGESHKVIVIKKKMK